MRFSSGVIQFIRDASVAFANEVVFIKRRAINPKAINVNLNWAPQLFERFGCSPALTRRSERGREGARSQASRFAFACVNQLSLQVDDLTGNCVARGDISASKRKSTRDCSRMLSCNPSLCLISCVRRETANRVQYLPVGSHRCRLPAA
jgi:hypothetical protein